MPSTPNKGYSVPTTGTEIGTWGDDLNTNTFGVIDANLGTIVALSLSASNVTLNATQSQALTLQCTGALLANVQITTSAIGFFYVANATTGNFTLTVRNASVATAATIPKGSVACILSDGTNGCRIGSASGFETGVSIASFRMAAAPVGWTKDTATDDAALRLVSGTGAGTGGTVAFSTAFVSQAVAGTVGDTTLTIDQIPLHGHSWRQGQSGTDTTKTDGGFGLAGSGGNGANKSAYTGTPSDTSGQQIGGSGGGLSHTHSFTGTPIDLAIKYVNIISATKN